MKNEKLLETVSTPPPGKETASANPPVALPALSTPASNVAGAALANREKSKGGRHPKGCNCGNCVQSNPSLRSEVSRKSRVAPVSEFTEIDRALAKQAISAVTYTLDAISLLVLDKALRKRGADDATVDAVTEKAVLSEPTRKGITESGAAVAEKYNVLKFAPEVSLFMFLTQWATGLTMAIVKIGKIPPPESANENQN